MTIKNSNQKSEIFRRWVDQRNWNELKQQSEAAYGVSRKAELLPFIALANAQLGLIQAGRDAAGRAEAALDQLDTAAKVDLAAVYLLAQLPQKASHLLEAAVQELPA